LLVGSKMDLRGSVDHLKTVPATSTSISTTEVRSSFRRYLSYTSKAVLTISRGRKWQRILELLVIWSVRRLRVKVSAHSWSWLRSWLPRLGLRRGGRKRRAVWFYKIEN
jgi:hypothetical protein